VAVAVDVPVTVNTSPLSAPVTVADRIGFVAPYALEAFVGTTVSGAGVTTKPTDKEVLAKVLESVGVNNAFKL
jgi:hypothetical protein